MNKNEYISFKKSRRENKRSTKRSATCDEVIFIFEKILEGWKTIRIYNTIIQNNPQTLLDKKKVETISTGNCKIFESELTADRFVYYNELRENIYKFHSQNNLLIQKNVEC
jgi:predicted transcriptional regulator